MLTNEKKIILRKAILATLTYFDILNYPLTLTEIWQYLLFCPNNNEFTDNKLTYDKDDFIYNDFVEFFLNDEIIDNLINKKNNYYFFKTNKNICNRRNTAYNITERKYKRLLKYIKFIANVPFIKSLCVCNSMAYSNPHEGSDFDLFVITNNKRIYTARFLAYLLQTIFRLRPLENNCRDKVCLSFWVTQDNLDLSQVMLADFDIYFLYWLNQLIPIYEEKQIMDRFYQENRYIKRYLPNFLPYWNNKRRKVTSAKIKSILEFLLKGFWGDLLELMFKKIQHWRFPAYIKNNMNKNTCIVINDNMLKFHGLEDRRKKYLETFKQQYNILLKDIK